MVPIWKRFTTVLRTLTSVKQLSLYGAVAEMRENVNPITIERGDKLWEDSRVPRLCQIWSRQTCLWIMMILCTKNFYCKDAENELNSYHNKTEWANFVRMHYSWLLLKSDSISWRKTLKNFHISQIQWPLVSTPCQERKVHLNRRIRGITKIRPVLEVTTCCPQGKYGVEIRIKSVWT